MEYIHGTATKMTVCVENAQHPLIDDSGSHCSIVAREYLDNNFPNWEKQLLPTKEKNLKECNIRLNTEFVVLEDAHIQGFLLGTDYQRIYSIDIYNSNNSPIAIEELLNEFREGKFSASLTTKQKLSLLKILRKNRPEFAIGAGPLGKIRGHNIGLCPDVERLHPPMVRRPPYPESLENRREIEKQINELLDMDFIRKIGHNEIVEITTPVLITWNYGKSRFCGYFRALNTYTKADRSPIPRIPNALHELEKAKYITNMDCMKGFHQNGVKLNSMKLLRSTCHMGLYEYTRMPFGIKNSPAHIQRMMNSIFQE
ncbi:hypothetical protein O181_045939 [Austropuccinia psidii MF-1]|uniref:Reverse transcriptase domain-containing protein n=1 Tax=Austropuccinia psidii MF-1 TaxID=1389203 RepID=A0A9Q3DMZ7_9BASI|nr:hypothetical protein [Austropuccinia psidii MF-1]